MCAPYIVTCIRVTKRDIETTIESSKKTVKARRWISGSGVCDCAPCLPSTGSSHTIARAIVSASSLFLVVVDARDFQQTAGTLHAKESRRGLAPPHSQRNESTSRSTFRCAKRKTHSQAAKYTVCVDILLLLNSRVSTARRVHTTTHAHDSTHSIAADI